MGVALIQLNDALRVKGKKLHTGYFIFMPENFVILYEPFSETVTSKMLAHASVSCLGDVCCESPAVR